MRDIHRQLAALGATPEMIRNTLVDGRLLADVEAESKAKPHRDGFDSKWERLYALHLDDLRADHVVSQWDHHCWRILIERPQGGKKGAWYLPDFVVWLRDGTLEIHEIKGHMREAARVRFLACRRLYPKIRWRMIRRGKNGWEEVL